MMRSLAARFAGVLVFVLALSGLVGLVQASGCASETVGSDLGVVESGCRAPSACYKIGADCPCNRADVATTCRVCDPRVEACTCSPIAPVSQCLAESNVCVGRSTELCPGMGARCLPAGSTCATSGGAPPNLVGAGPSGALEPHCAYKDDVCCPGVLEADGGATD